MSAKQPDEIARAAVRTGAQKARTSWDKTLVASFLAGAYIALGGLVAVVVSSGLDPEVWGTLPTLFTGVAFTLGLVLVLLAGSSLLTGNMLLVPLSAMSGRIGLGDVARNLGLVLLGNVAGALLVAFFLATETGVIGGPGSADGTSAAMTYERLAGIAETKALDETAYQVFLRAVGANWLVCLAVWVALGAESVGSKVIGLFLPVMAFVAMGFDHVVANMFFLPAAVWAGVPDLGWGDVLRNWGLAGIGNLVGAVVFVATTYWYLYLKDQPEDATEAG
ncbi:formate/nitrite transporter family protein [Vallicoccus soli]|uniref:Formate/nitrite transporter family protein n=1 Tax=Vallicoccus soli TaxID=2339232 RepID=A0A3A3YU60_9ACTN|nr:formate/nitrite transporter family protein [Vallicoccus soli]RJK94263.1 formate/nitrite transporter family protein [Vallicoccus soli]